MYRVIIVDDQKISRKLFEFEIAGMKGFEVAYSLESAEVADIYVLNNDIDLIIMDVVMQDGSDGLTAAAAVKRISPDVKIIIVTSMADTEFLTRAKEIGCEGFWLKEFGNSTLESVVRRVMSGKTVYPDEIPAVRIGKMMSDEFSETEIKILRGVVSGLSNKEIASSLEVSTQTVKNKITSMLERTGFANRTKLAIETSNSGFIVSDR